MSKIKVSVCCITYNQEKYIKQALDSILNQHTNFDYQIIVHDDASSDATKNIIQEYCDLYPERIITIFQNENQYSKGKNIFINFIAPIIDSEYITFCEGDDFWSDKYKLQKQFDYLENNQDFGFVYTDYNKLYEETGDIEYDFYKKNKIITPEGDIYEYLLINRFLVTPTFCIRTKFIKKYFDYRAKYDFNWKQGDLPLILFVAYHTKFGYIPDSTATYRVINNSLSHSIDLKKSLEFFKSSYDISLFYIKDFPCSEKVKNEILYKYWSGMLRYNYKLNNYNDANEAYNELKKQKSASIDDFLYFFGSKNKFTKLISKIIFRIFRKLRIIKK